MKIKQIQETEAGGLEISSLIDMVFLLLVYFISTCTLVKSEADLGLKLPGLVQQAVKVDMPDEQVIEVQANGRVLLNGREFRSPPAQPNELPSLVDTLTLYKQASDAGGNKALITVMAEDKAKHQRVIDVMNACAGAGIENVTFSGGGGK